MWLKLWLRNYTKCEQTTFVGMVKKTIHMHLLFMFQDH